MAKAVATTLRFQEIWTPAVPKFSYSTYIVAAVFFGLVLIARVTVRQKITNYGYAIANAQEETVRLSMEKQELELIHSVSLRSDNLYLKAKSIGLTQPKADQVWSFSKE